MSKTIAAAFILALIITACDLITTRTPEVPKTSGNSLVPASTPEILFSNFKKSVQEKVLENYQSCFSNSSFSSKKYIFIPVPSSISRFSELTEWGIEKESQFFKNLSLKPGSSISLVLSNQTNNQLGDSALYQFDYTLTLNSTDNSIAGEYKGTSQFKIFLDSRNQWSIVQWQDIQAGESKPWSELKGRLY